MPYTPSTHPWPRSAAWGCAPLACLCIVTSVSAQTRWVVVNGQRLSDRDVAALARANCSAIPDGAYWLNRNTGAWGYAGQAQAQGVVGDGCQRGNRAQGQASTYGPYATLRRAEQEANTYRRQGLQAKAFHNGDGYYARVWR